MKQSSALGLHLLGYGPAFFIAGLGISRYVASQSGNELASLSYLLYIYFIPFLFVSFLAWLTSTFDRRPEYIIRRGAIIASLIAHVGSVFLWIWCASGIGAGIFFFILAIVMHCAIAAHAYSMLRIRLEDEDLDPIY